MVVPRTGLAGRMRAAMRAYTRAFTIRRLAIDLGIPLRWRAQNRLREALKDFKRRGEVIVNGDGWYRYNAAWRSGKLFRGDLKQRIVKAIYLADQPFRAASVELLSGCQDRHYITAIMRDLRKAGYVENVGKHKGNEFLYRILDRDRYRKEVMG